MYYDIYTEKSCNYDVLPLSKRVSVLVLDMKLLSNIDFIESEALQE